MAIHEERLDLLEERPSDLAVDEAIDLIEEVRRLRGALAFVDQGLDYLRATWGDEGVTRTISDRVKAALKGD